MISRLLDIRPDEGPRFFLLYLMYFVMLTGFNWGEAIVEAAFLHRVGVEFLPLAIAGNALCSILGTCVYTAFADRVDNGKLLVALCGLSALGTGLSLLLLGFGYPAAAFPLLYMILNVPLRDIFNVHWPTYVNGFYDTRSAKRIIPVLGSGARVAGIVAGVTMPLLNALFSPSGIVTLFLVSVLAMAALAWLMPRTLGEQPGGRAQTEESEVFGIDKAVSHIAEGYRYVSKSTFLHWMAAATFTTMVLLAYVNYQTGKVMLDELKTVQGISNFTGLLNGLANLVILPFQLFFLNRIIGGMGLGNAALLFPSTLVLAVGSLVAFPGMVAAALGNLSRSTLRTTLRNPVDNLLYNAVPLRMKGRARAFIVGLVVPIGSLFGALLLLVPRVFPAVPLWLLPSLVAGVALAHLLSAWAIRTQYGRALIRMLEQENFSFVLYQEGLDFNISDPSTLQTLEECFARPDATAELRAFMAQLIGKVGGKPAERFLIRAVREDAGLRASLVNIMVASDFRGNSALELYGELLGDPSPEVRESALNGLELVMGADDGRLLGKVVELLDDPDRAVRSRALLVLARSPEFSGIVPAVEALESLLADPSEDARALGVRVLGESCGSGNHRLVLERLCHHFADPSDAVRLRAIMAAESILEETQSEAGETITKAAERLLHDPAERVRHLAVGVLGRIGTAEACRRLLGFLRDASPEVRGRCADELVKGGRALTPMLLEALEASDSQMRKMAAIALSRIDAREHGHLLESLITGNLRLIYDNHIRCDTLLPHRNYPSIAILGETLQEQNRALLDELFTMLSALHGPSEVRVVADSLRSADSRLRANGVEALECLTSRHLANLMVPLFEPDTTKERLLSLYKSTWRLPVADAAQCIGSLAEHPDDAWLRMAAACALGEMGAALRPAPESPVAVRQGVPQLEGAAEAGLQTGAAPDATEELKPARRPRRAPPKDIFGVIAGLEPQPRAAEGPVNRAEAPLALARIEVMLEALVADSVDGVRFAASNALRKIRARSGKPRREEGPVLLSTVERVIFLKEVVFFGGMTIEQLKILADVCEEEFFAAESRVFSQGDAGGALYIVLDGRVGIEQERRSGSFARLATLEARSTFGETELFDDSPRTVSATALRDTLTLKLRREPLIALARQNPDLSLELIKVLSGRLREANERIAELTRSRPRELHKLFDQLDSSEV